MPSQRFSRSFTDNADLIAHTKEDMNIIRYLISKACTPFGQLINLKKMKLKFTLLPGYPNVKTNIFVQSTRLNVIDPFVYLGSTLSRHGSLDSEINLRIEKASKAFGKLKSHVVWVITIKTTLNVKEACVLSGLLNSLKTWITFHCHIKT